ncbi:MAG: methyltransferase domain-containing protein [Armatimonadetes bacterium]|jgi:SAM-dependent methyltransferase|nr:methyltransferase domain-containing protein [Armatimonadota bacterium]
MAAELPEQYEARRRFFNEHAEHWLEMWYPDGDTGGTARFAAQFDRLCEAVPLRPGDHVLDVGCGTGVLVPHLLARIGEEGVLYELDYAERMIAVNRRMHDRPNIRFLVADVLEAPVPAASCSAVFCFSCFPHLADKAAALAAMSAALKPEGYLAIAHFASSEELARHHQGSSPVSHDCLPEEATMRALIAGAGLEWLQFVDEPGFYLVLARKPGAA